MINKIIHYCWFGKNPKSDFVEKCIQTWKEKLPDYEIKEWNEDNFDFNICEFTKKAYELKKWAFVADYARLYALYNFGGIYLDTDVEVINSFNPLLDNKVFMCFEDSNHVSTACIGAEKGNDFINKCINYYDNITCKDESGLDTTPNSEIIYRFLFDQKESNIMENIVIGEVTIYSNDYFSPKSFYDKKVTLTDNTYCIHHFDGTWKSSKDKFKDKIKITIRKILGDKLYLKMKRKFK